MFDLIPNLIASVLTVLFPVFASYKALRTSDPAQLSPWLMYWVSFGLFTVFENYTYWVLGWLPLYGTIRLIFLLYLMLPQTQGARLAYQQYIHPFLAQYERQIEDWISEGHAKLQAVGLDYITQLIEIIKKNVLGMQTPPPQQHAASTASGGSYAQSLLSRFNLPTAREGLAAPAGDFYGLLSSATSILGGKPNTSPQSQVEELSRNLIPSHVRTPSEKQRFVNQQREKLQVLLQALDRESGDHGEGLSRNRSEVSFDRIEEDEATEGAHREGKAGWFGWAKEQAKTSGIDLAYGEDSRRH